jgi:hypothetical protein
MRLQWLLHDALDALPAKAAFVKGFNSSQANDWWSTTSLNATGGGQARTWPSSAPHRLMTQPTQLGAAPLLFLSPGHIHRKGAPTPGTKAWEDTPSNGNIVVCDPSKNGSGGFSHERLDERPVRSAPRINGLHINPLELIRVIVSVVLALAWATPVVAPAGGGASFQDLGRQYLHPVRDEEHSARH